MATASAANRNAEQLAELYAQFRSDRARVPAAWRELFESLDARARSWLEQRAAGAERRPVGVADIARPAGPAAPRAASARGDYAAARDSMRAMLLIRAFRLRGHLEARLDPLGLAAIESHSDLDPRSYGFDDADFERAIYCDGHLGLDFATIPEIVRRARAIYCGTIGIEYLHILNPRERDWIMARMEGASYRDSFGPERRRAIFEALTVAEGFEQF
ncbi:MAG TPA: 2-oxoglutarate dehydrogenase E1 component, partial [Myxococcota bacterium]|nr:2-oxoglutarate dehydrogenase E1 component [Myxococcota bacterium]